MPTSSDLGGYTVIRVVSPVVRFVSYGRQGPPGPPGAGISGPVAWADVEGKPSEFPPEAHQHPITDVENLPAVLTSLQEAVDGKEAAGAADAVMTAHVEADDPHTQYAAATALASLEETVEGKEEAGVAATLMGAHAGTGGAAHTEATGSEAGFMSAAHKTKLDGVAVGATANATDAQLRDRATHTGAQEITTITGLPDALASKVAVASVGQADGVAPLGPDAKIPSVFLPGFVDDVIEVADVPSLPAVGETGKIYITLNNNKQWRWGGSVYVEISASPGSTDAVPEGALNLYFTGARVLSTVLSGLSFAVATAITAGDTVLQALGKLQAQLSGHTSNTANPHGVTKAQVGLSNVDNTSDVDKPISEAAQVALDAKYNQHASLFTGDLNSLTSNGYYAVGSGATNMPVAANGTCYVSVAGANVSQLYIRTPNSSLPQMYYRTYATTGAVWSGWIRVVDTTGATMTGALVAASGSTADPALCVGSSASGFSGSTDIRCSIEGTLYWITGGSNFRSGSNGNYSLGTTGNRWSQLWCTAGAFNTSDARLKRLRDGAVVPADWSVSPMTEAEISVAKELAKHIGLYKWAASIQKKGSTARLHAGITVQKVVSLFDEAGLDAYQYGVVGYDSWADITYEVPAVLDAAGEVVHEALTMVETPAGDCYSIRPDQFDIWLAAGFNARLSALEAA